MTKEELLEQLCMMQLEDLLALVRSGQASAGHHAVIRGILKDNGIKVNTESNEGNPLVDLLKSIEPVMDEE